MTTPDRATRLGRRPRGDHGVATMLMLGLCCVLALVGAAAASLGAVAVARQRAASAADLGALAAADAVLSGPAASCARAEQVARAAAARLTSCSIHGDVVDVVAEVRPTGLIGRWGRAAVRARAGPRRLEPQ